MITLGKAGRRKIRDYRLSRYACYLIIQNADPQKEIVALGQTYLAVQTRPQEAQAGVISSLDFAIFHDHGYMGLYGELRAADLQQRKELQSGQQILDHMGSTELAANLFRATQTEEKLRREQIASKEAANMTHLQVVQVVRRTIQELGGTMPEELPTPDTSIKQLEQAERKRIKQAGQTKQAPQLPLFEENAPPGSAS